MKYCNMNMRKIRAIEVPVMVEKRAIISFTKGHNFFKVFKSISQSDIAQKCHTNVKLNHFLQGETFFLPVYLFSLGKISSKMVPTLKQQKSVLRQAQFLFFQSLSNWKKRHTLKRRVASLASTSSRSTLFTL